MSIYRRPGNGFLTEVPAATPVWRPKKTEEQQRQDKEREDAEWRDKRRPGEPSNVSLPRTLAWATHLPPRIQPHGLLRSFGRVANLLAANWDDADATYAYFE